MNTTQSSIPSSSKTIKPRLQLLSKKPSSSRILSNCKRPTRIRYSNPIDTTSNMKHGNDSIPNLYAVEKRMKLIHLPCWNVPSLIGDLPCMPILYIPSTTSTLIRHHGSDDSRDPLDNTGSQSLNPRTIAERIVKSVSSLSSVGNYNNKKVSKC